MSDSSVPLAGGVTGGNAARAAFFEAVRKENMRQIRQMLSANGGLAHVKGEGGTTALTLAATKGNLELIILLLDSGSDVNAQVDVGLAVIHLAAEAGFEDVVKALLDKGASPSSVTSDKEACNALHMSARCGHEGVFKLLLERGGPELVHVTDSSGFTALHWAADRGKVGIIRMLLDNGSDIDAEANGGGTALQLACAKGHESAVKVLLAAGAMLVADDRGRTPLHSASMHGHEGVCRLVVESGGAELVNVGATDGRTALHVAAEAGREGVVRILVKAGAEVDAKTVSGNAAIHLAARNGQGSVARALLQAGADFTATAPHDGRSCTARTIAELNESDSVLAVFDELDNVLSSPSSKPVDPVWRGLKWKEAALAALQGLVAFARGGFPWPWNATGVKLSGSSGTASWQTATAVEKVTNLTRVAAPQEQEMYLREGVSSCRRAITQGSSSRVMTAAIEVLLLWGWEPLVKAPASSRTAQAASSTSAASPLGELASAIRSVGGAAALKAGLRKALASSLCDGAAPVVSSKRGLEALCEICERWALVCLSADWIERLCGGDTGMLSPSRAAVSISRAVAPQPAIPQYAVVVAPPRAVAPVARVVAPPPAFPRSGGAPAPPRAIPAIAHSNASPASLLAEVVTSFRRNSFDPNLHLLRTALRELIAKSRADEGMEPDAASSISSTLRMLLAMDVSSQTKDFKTREQLERLIDAQGSAAPTRTHDSIYSANFEGSFLTGSRYHFETIGDECLALSGTEALRRFSSMVAFEEEQLLSWIPRRTHAAFKACLTSHGISPRLGAFMTAPDGGVAVLMQRLTDGSDDSKELHVGAGDSAALLGSLYSLAVRVEGGREQFVTLLQDFLDGFARKLAQEWTSRLYKRGPDDAQTASKSKSTEAAGFIELLAKLYGLYRSLVSTRLRGDLDCSRATTSFFESCLNMRPAADMESPADDGAQPIVDALVATLAASLEGRPRSQLPTAGAGKAALASRLQESEVVTEVQHTIPLFTFLANKDAFRDKYRDKAAWRLVHERSANMEAERLVVGTMKAVCGTNFTAHLATMMSDIAGAQDLGPCISAAKAKLRGVTGAASRLPGFSVRILTTEAWPAFIDAQPKYLPSEMTGWVKAFSEAYKALPRPGNAKRRLEFKYSLGSVDLEYHCEGKVFVISSLATLTALALLAVGRTRGQSCTVDQLADAMGLASDFSSTERMLAPLFKSPRLKHMQLLREKGKALDAAKPLFPRLTGATELELNPSFIVHSSLAVHPGRVELQSGLKGRQVEAAISESRKIFLQTAVTRTMKAGKTLSMKALIAEVIASTTLFQPRTSDVKKVIEDLIARDYLERDEANADVIKYLA